MTTIADIIGPEAAHGDPGRIRSIAQQAEDAHATADSIRSRLTSLQASQWSGAAANAYREKQDNELPHELGKLSTSFGLASGALGAYAGQLQSVQEQARALAAQRNQAQAELGASQQRERTTRQGLQQAQTARATNTNPHASHQLDHAVSDASRAAAAASRDRQAASDAIARIDQRAQALRHTLDRYAVACGERLAEASHQGIRNTFGSYFDRNVVNGVPGQVVGGAVHAVGNFAAQSAHLAAAATDFALNPDLQHLDKLADSYSKWVDAAQPIVTAVGVVALIAVAVIVVVGTGGSAAVAVVPMLTTIGTVASKTGTILGATKLASDSYLAARGDQSKYKRTGQDVAGDAFDVAVNFGLGKAAGTNKASVGKLSSSLDTYSRTGTPQAKGWITKRLPAIQVDTGQELAGKATEKLLTEDAVKNQVFSLIGPAPQAAPSPVHGPSTGLSQGPNTVIRVQVAPSNVPVLVAP